MNCDSRGGEKGEGKNFKPTVIESHLHRVLLSQTLDHQGEWKWATESEYNSYQKESVTHSRFSLPSFVFLSSILRCNVPREMTRFRHTTTMHTMTWVTCVSHAVPHFHFSLLLFKKEDFQEIEKKGEEEDASESHMHPTWETFILFLVHLFFFLFTFHSFQQLFQLRWISDENENENHC